jgi:hypothetical protein
MNEYRTLTQGQAQRRRAGTSRRHELTSKRGSTLRRGQSQKELYLRRTRVGPRLSSKDRSGALYQ